MYYFIISQLLLCLDPLQIFCDDANKTLSYIVFGFVAEESVIALFLAGIGPGLLLVGLFVGFSMIYARFSGQYTQMPKSSWAERKKSTVMALPSVLHPLYKAPSNIIIVVCAVWDQVAVS